MMGIHNFHLFSSFKVTRSQSAEPYQWLFESLCDYKIMISKGFWSSSRMILSTTSTCLFIWYFHTVRKCWMTLTVFFCEVYFPINTLFYQIHFSTTEWVCQIVKNNYSWNASAQNSHPCSHPWALLFTRESQYSFQAPPCQSISHH